MIERLPAEHDGLREALAVIRAIVAHSELPDMTQLADARWRLASRTMQHLASEDRHVYAVLAADPRAAVAAIGRRFQDDYGRAMIDYADHVRARTADRSRTDWTGYRAPTPALVDATIGGHRPTSPPGGAPGSTGRARRSR